MEEEFSFYFLVYSAQEDREEKITVALDPVFHINHNSPPSSFLVSLRLSPFPSTITFQ
jgi:hypothetical protein